MGLVWRNGGLFVADPPDLIVLKDNDGDGRADERQVLLTGFGHADNGSLHGLIFGPDGWLYMTLGQPDGYKLKRPDGTFLEGKSGALLRCRADGSGVELVARGFENLVEIEFLRTGEIVGTDNWFTRPEGGQRDALVHILEGGVYPLNAHARTERSHFQSGDLLPALAIYPAVALSGMTRYRGQQFPSPFGDCLFTAQFNARRVVAHRLVRHGATFRSEDDDFVATEDPDFHPSDVLEDIDGTLLVVDNGRVVCASLPDGTNSQGAGARCGIFRIAFGQRTGEFRRRKGREKSSGPSEEQTLAAPPEMALAGLRSTNSEIAAATARACGRRGDKTADAALQPLLLHAQAHVRLAAAEALAHCGSSNAIPALTAAMAVDNEPLLEHALTFALYQQADKAALFALLENPSLRVQKAALALLDQAPHRALSPEAVLRRVVSPDESLRRAAIAIMQKHPEWGSRAEPLIRDMLGKSEPSSLENSALQDLLLAYQSNPSVQALAAGLSSTPMLRPADGSFCSIRLPKARLPLCRRRGSMPLETLCARRTSTYASTQYGQ
jgi:putative membrane-bound dehydrogenase-like protein